LTISTALKVLIQTLLVDLLIARLAGLLTLTYLSSGMHEAIDQPKLARC